MGYFNWFSNNRMGRGWDNELLCQYADRGVKQYTRLKTIEKDKTIDMFQVCIHSWKKETQIVYGPEGDKNLTDVFCMKLSDFLTKMDAAVAPTRFKQNKFIVKHKNSDVYRKMGINQRFKVLANNHMKVDDEMDTV